MKYKILHICIYFLFAISACKQNQNNTFKEFPKSIALSGDEISMGTSFYRGVHLIDLNDTTMILFTFPNKKLLHLIHKDTYEILTSTGKRGRGPSEIANPGAPFVNKNNGVVYLPARGKAKIMKFYIDSIFNNSSYKPKTSIPIPSSLVTKLFFRPYKGNLFSYRSISQNETLISFFNHEGKIIDSLNVPNNLHVYPELNEQIRRTQVNYNFLFHPSKPLVCITYRYADIIAIIDTKGKVIKKIQGPDMINQTPSFDKKLINTYTSDSYADSQYIYCLYAANKLRPKDNSASDNIQNLHIFSWKGEPIMRIKFDHIVSSFIIDKQRDKIFAYSQEEGKIFSYKFPL